MMLTPIVVQVFFTLFINFLSLVVTQSTCGPKVSARLLMDIPCDMSKTNFCELSGTIYPWSAVRRYIYENQGLLRRMYGDQRHYSIVTNEIQEVNEKYDNIFIYDQETKFFESNQINHQSPYAVKYQPQFRPRAFFMDEHDEDESVTQSSSSSPSTTIINQQTNSSESSNNHLNLNNQQSSNNNGTLDKLIMLKESENNTYQESTTMKSESSSTTVINEQSSSSESDYSESGVTVKSEDETTESPIGENDEMTKQVDKVLHMIETNNQQESSESSTSSQSETLQTSSQPQSTSSPPQPTTSSTTTPMSTIETHSPHTDNNNNNNNSDQPPPPVTPKHPSAPIETDTTPKGKGVNACPVKEEVIAPYWANNTRGEILALLNVYPFEQYVHWEKCAHENSQMFCRDGCRCEQQYRLHRLLAFDPKNECRGIFADWFRFPSCCVCICYDLPETNLFYRSNKRKSRL